MKTIIRITFLFFLSISLFIPVVHASPSIEDYGNLPDVEQLAVSPDGSLIAFRRTTDGKDGIYIYSLVKGEHISGVDVSEVKPRDIYFLNNDALFLRASEHRRVRGFRGQHEFSTGYVMHVDTGKVDQLLVPGDGVVYPAQTGLGKVVGLSPDKSEVYMPAYRGKPRSFGASVVAPPYYLLRVNLSGRPRAKPHEKGSKDAIDFFVNHNGDLVALEEFDNENNLHTLTAFHGEEEVEIFRKESPYITVGFAGLTPDQKHVVMLDEDSRTGRSSYYLMSLKDGSITGPTHSRDDADIVRVISSIQRVVQGVVYSGFTPSYKFFDEDLNERVKEIQANFPDHNVSLASWSPDWKHIIVLVEGSQSSGDYFLFSEGEKPQYVASARPNILPEHVNPLATVTYRARDGMAIPTLLTIPRDRVQDMANLPAVIMPHGGPASYDQIGFDYWAQALASEGYMVVMPQFRGSSGFGLEHELAGHGEWGGKMQNDITDAVSFFVDQGIIDPDRICIAGASYGGYAALAGGAFTPDLYKCVVSINGIGDLKDFRNWLRRQRGRSSRSLAYWDTQIGGEEYTDEVAKARSPAEHAENFTAPVLLLHGDDDEIVDIAQSEVMEKALKRADKDVVFIELEGDDHWLSNSKMRLKALKETIRFVNDHLE